MLNNREELNKQKIELDKKEERILEQSEVIDDLELENFTLRDKIKQLEKVIEAKDLTICKLNIKLCASEGQLDSIRNYRRMIEGR